MTIASPPGADGRLAKHVSAVLARDHARMYLNAPRGAARAGKPVPVRPPSTRGAGLGAAIPAKPQGMHQAAPLTAWSVTLTASPNLLWPTQYSSLTATANADVGPTPYYIEIFSETGALLAVCGSGTSCSATFTPSYAGSNLVAFVTTYSAAFPPPGIVASSNVATTYLRIIP